MGLQESKILERKPSKTKSNLSQKSLVVEDISEFVTQLSTLACLQSTSDSTYQYVAFQKLPFTGHYAALPLCSFISNSGSSVFVCYDCSTDDHAYLCEQCFEKGNHDSHRFSVFPNNDGWRLLFCRCGDSQYMKKKTICQTHLQAPKVTVQTIDKKDLARFTAYSNETFKILFSLMQKNRHHYYQNALFGYLNKITQGNLYFSKIVCEFLLQKNIIDGQCSNLKKYIKMGGVNNFKWSKIFRNLNFASQYKAQMLTEMIQGLNQSQTRSNQFFELIINFAGKIQNLTSLAKDKNITLGLSDLQKAKSSYTASYYQLLIKTQADITQVWKCLVRNKKLQGFFNNQAIMKAIFKALVNEEQYILLILEQLLGIKQKVYDTYLITCLMILVPQYFIPSLATKKNKTKSCLDKLEKQFNEFYTRLFLDLNTHSRSEKISSDLLLILPYFSFGLPIINKLWDEFERRVQVISKNKQRKVIKQASDNFFWLITGILRDFMTWDHKVLRDANKMNLVSFTKDTKLIEKVLVQFFDTKSKLPRLQLLQNVDIYTQKQRSLAKDLIKKNLRYNPKKGKYYNITKKLPNNSYNFQDLNIGAPLKFTQWQQFIGKKFFTQSFYRLVPSLIKVAQKALMEDIQMVKTVSNISVCLCLLNKNQKINIKEVTRNFIKQIPDVREDIYYVLAKIRDRLQLDLDDVEEAGKKGSKKVKLDLITQIRDKKYQQIKAKHQKMRLKWLKEAEKLDSDHQEETDDKICNICKQKDTDKRRFVYPCNFTRNNVISTLLRSDVTDLDINICLHKVHQDCFDKIRQKKSQCPICKFQVNCYIPDKPLADQSYTKNWLRNFQNIVTSINLQSGKSFNSDWATIFLTYLIFSKSFKLLLKNTEIQQKQRLKANELILLHYKSQLQKWPELTKQAIKRADKTVKGQVTRQSPIKKVVKSLVFDLVLQQITNQPFKNVKRIQKKFRQMINMVGTENSQKINEAFDWSKNNQAIQNVFSSNVAEQVDQLFKIRQLPSAASQYLSKTSIKCPMCNKYQPTTWECLFCEKLSCQNCINPRFHCQNDHKGSGIILHRSDARYQLYHQNRQVQMDSLYRNQFQQGWVRNQNPQGWVAHIDQIYQFFDTILHSQNPFRRQATPDDNSDNEGQNPNRGWGNNWSNQTNDVVAFGGFGGFGGFGSNNNQMIQQRDQELVQEEEPEEQHNQEQEEQEEQEEQQEQQQRPRKKQKFPSKPARRSR